ncbi:MAG: 50S ribosomal protein L15 [Candidatus Hodgkinia cicadicola]
MSSLSSLVKGTNKQRRRLGRGRSSSKGKTCGRGHKGQRSRSGSKRGVLEGGQTPLHRRVPKRGFMRAANKRIRAVGLDLLMPHVVDGGCYSVATLKAILGVKSKRCLKLLYGEFNVCNLKLFCDSVSDSAETRIRELGGCVVLR